MQGGDFLRGHVLFTHGNYGFIRAEDYEKEVDIFFHNKDVVGGSLYSGAYVEFELSQEGNRIKAINVRETIETEDGFEVVKVKLFNLESGTFDLYNFYLEVLSKINIGLRYAIVIGDVILASSIKLSMEQGNKVISGYRNKENYREILDGYQFKFI